MWLNRERTAANRYPGRDGCARSGRATRRACVGSGSPRRRCGGRAAAAARRAARRAARCGRPPGRPVGEEAQETELHGGEVGVELAAVVGGEAHALLVDVDHEPGEAKLGRVGSGDDPLPAQQASRCSRCVPTGNGRASRSAAASPRAYTLSSSRSARRPPPPGTWPGWCCGPRRRASSTSMSAASRLSAATTRTYRPPARAALAQVVIFAGIVVLSMVRMRFGSGANARAGERLAGGDRVGAGTASGARPSASGAARGRR